MQWKYVFHRTQHLSVPLNVPCQENLMELLLPGECQSQNASSGRLAVFGFSLTCLGPCQQMNRGTRTLRTRPFIVKGSRGSVLACTASSRGKLESKDGTQLFLQFSSGQDASQGSRSCCCLPSSRELLRHSPLLLYFSSEVSA